MANAEHLALLRQGVEGWNAWRAKKPSVTPDLSRADLAQANLRGADLRGADLFRSNFVDADLFGANLTQAHLIEADLSGADLTEANFADADFTQARLDGANLTRANLRLAHLVEADLFRANLTQADLTQGRLLRSDLSGANLTQANLRFASFVETSLAGTVLTGCRVYGVSVWNVTLSKETKQQDLVITGEGEPEVTIDNIEVAQFVHLLLHNEKIRDVIDTIGRKGVLLLGRFTEGRIEVLNRLREELRQRGYVPIVFNFDKPETKDFTETVRLLASLSKFVIADITKPKSTPLELQATIPEVMVPFQPIIEEGQEPFAMMNDLWNKHRDWVFEPLHYSSLDALVEALDNEIIGPAELRFDELIVRKAEKMKGRHV